MTAVSIRARLARDPDLGAGNVLTTLVALGADLDRPAFTFDTDVDGVPAWTALTVRRLDERVRARAAALRALGIGRRDPVAVTATSAADNILTFLALARLGAIPALINAKLAPEITALYVSRLGAVGVLADAARREALAPHGVTLLAPIEDLGAADPADAPEAYRFHRDDPVAITHSSGTTGVPKAVLHSHASLYAANRHRLRMPKAQGSDRLLSALPAPHAATLIAINLVLSSESQLLALSSQTGASVVDAIERWRPGGVLGFAATWSEMAKTDLRGRDLDSVALWWNTGDCAHEAHIRRLISLGYRQVSTREGRVRKPGSNFIDGLGSSEMGHSHFYITHSSETSRYGRCIGRPHTFAEPVVLDPDGNELPPGEVGELGTKSPTLSLGYWNDSVTTYRTRVRGYFLTGDLVYRDEEGYFYHVDRLVDSVDLGGGKRLHTALSEERVLNACPDVADCTVVAVRVGDTVVTDVLLQLDAAGDPSADRTEAIRTALGPDVAATLREVVVVDDSRIPLGPTGKVRKVALREQYLQDAG
ncbi:class I adenylate-forming enzyme family protein [Actinokineospora sp. NBRC 105648]|uniref:class I adenylate-forming enzyme family protein n=1 Tax=Actinokineospora sp. NBRC 105648 TaxID=3032206 RepID=UPI0024A09302|nr:class I adenylate-forming enzyme family protein [Actinokineospora sp. NBRC 105648]GLZ39784.1 long-chain-fatty-acid--CoA ligase [Actinokineospora sp. NBRC 105648]